MKKAKVPVTHELTAQELANLLWEGSEEFFGAAPSFLEEHRAEGRPVNWKQFGLMKDIISQQLEKYGSRHVENGPPRGWEDEEQEEWYLILVKHVFHLREDN